MRKLGFCLMVIFIAMTVSVQSQTLPSYLPTNGLVGWWPFNGNANDESGNGNHGTVNGVTLAADRFGNANRSFMFNGINCCGTPDAIQEVAITNSLLNLASDFTISIWMNSSNVSKYQQCLFNSINHTGFAVELNNEHVPSRLTYGAGPANAFWDLIYAQGNSVNFTNEVWYHVVFVKSGITYKVYLNTILDGQTDLPVSVGYNQDVGIRIGSIGGGHEVFKGRLDDVAIYNRVLNSAEIAALYNAQDIPMVTSGCMDLSACNYNASATLDDGSCTFPSQIYLNCDGTCINDTDNDGVCNEIEIPLPAYVPSNGLVAWYPFNGNANDESGNGNHGTVNGATLTTDRNGNANSAYGFDGVNDIISATPSLPISSSPRTVSCWFSTIESVILSSQYPQIQTMTGWGDASSGAVIFPQQVLAPTGRAYFESGSSANQLFSQNPVNDGQWYNVVTTYEGPGTRVKIYIDGVIQDSSSAITLGTVNSYFGIGNAPWANVPFKGQLDDIAIYNRALTPEEITALYTGTSSNNGGGGTAGTPAASVPAGIPYQAVIRDNAGTALVNAPVTVRFTLHQNTTDGTVEYQETQSLTTNAIGLINTQFGAGTATQGTFASINWSNTTKFIQVEANTGAGYVDMGTQQMMSVPFAMKANQANEAGKVKNASLPVFANNAAALAGGLVPGDMYRTATGDLKIVY